MEIETISRQNDQLETSEIDIEHITKLTNHEYLAKRIGSDSFKREYGLKYAYLTGSMYRGISSKELVVKVGKAGFMGFLGTGGLSLERIRFDIEYIQSELTGGEAYGANLIANLSNPDVELDTIDLYMEKGVRCIEASAFMQVTQALVLYRLRGLELDSSGVISCRNKIIAKVSRPEVAKSFLSPPPERIINKLLSQKKITPEQASWGAKISIASAICVEADSGGHTDQGIATALLPAIQRLRAEMGIKENDISVGLAGGIGTPEAIAAAFAMGADFVLTGSINQCTVESGAADTVKDLLQDINVQDTAYAPAGDMFEIGSKVQVLKKGVFFPSRANRLHELYNQYNSLDELPVKIRSQLENKYFKKSFDDIWEETITYLSNAGRTEDINKATTNQKHKMSLVFRWYFGKSMRLAMEGDETQKVDYQVHTGPALGAFNQWVKGTDWESWKARHVDEIGKKLMEEAANLLVVRLQYLLKTTA